ncbi:MAG: hypothetical protein APF80_15455 [Alphaproteobacteria bacterium BRH_c36]|nr:MAG: hypothetical protein APF80_15455 [Alphaproteobacteria bacterium BRH_c36]
MDMMKTLNTAVIIGTLAALSLLPFESAAALGWRNQQAAEIQRGYTVAESRYGNGTVTGAVRPSRLGPQVQLPSGRWEYCRRLCSETLRVETIDFWDSRSNGIISDECGVFGCLTIKGHY